MVVRECGPVPTFPQLLLPQDLPWVLLLLDVIPVANKNFSNTIREPRKLFATHGIREVIVSDNGTAFTSADFSNFMTKNGIKHLKTAPYHPVTNGLAERAVQTFKTAMKVWFK